MQAWWESLTALERVFAAAAIPATLLLIIQLITTLIGLGGQDGDADGPDLDGDGVPDGIDLDLDGDGIPDGIDLDGDGVPDEFYESPELDIGL